MPVERDMLTTLVTIGVKTDVFSLRSQVGNGSKMQLLVAAPTISCSTSSFVTGVNSLLLFLGGENVAVEQGVVVGKYIHLL